MDDLAKALKALRDKPSSLQAAVDFLEREAPTPQSRETETGEESGYVSVVDLITIFFVVVDYKQLVSQYHKTQTDKKRGLGQGSSKNKKLNYFSVRILWMCIHTVLV
jgi:hypothetical protein